MRLSIFLIVLTSLQSLAFNNFAQSGKLNIKVENTTVSEVLQLIEKESGYFLFYNNKVLDLDEVVTLDLTNKSVTEVLDALLKDKGVSYTISNKQIVLSKKQTNGNLQDSLQQQKSVSGKVTDENGEPLPGVTVLIKGTTNGTVTNFDGEYTLANIPEDATLHFSFVGMKSQEVVVGSQTTVDVTLVVEAIGIEEVVAIGYGTVKKSDLTGSVGSIKAEDIEVQRVARIDQALQGRISGVQVTSASGAPGSGVSIRIRGGNSIQSSNEPLFVVDGFIGGGDLNSINPSDIESLEILKDASATAIYGSRGANGVVLITTKRGNKAKEATVSYNGYYGIQNPVKRLDLLNGPEFADFANEYFMYRTGNTDPSKFPFPSSESNANTDWQDVMFSTASVTDHNLSVAKATDNGNYFFSVNYFDQEGIILSSGFKRYQFRFNFDQKIGEAIRVGASITGANTLRDNPSVGGYGIFPTAPIVNEDGTFFSINQIHGSVFNNPLAQEKYILNETITNRGHGNLYLQLNPIEGFTLKSTFGFDITNTKNNSYTSVDLPTRVFFKSGGTGTVTASFPISIQNENTIQYTKSIEKHDFTFLGGFTYQHYVLENLSLTGDKLLNDANLYHNLSAGDPTLYSMDTGESEWTILSYLFRVNYSFNGKYLLTMSGRADGSSRLAESNKWAFFPSAALAWRLSEEQFIKNLNIFDDLKLRISYGKTGNQSVPVYATLARLNSGTTLIGGSEVNTFVQGLAANENLSWETTEQFDLGLNAGFLDNRLNLELDLYSKTTNDLLLNAVLARQTGFSSQLKNIGSIENKGLEVTINAIPVSQTNFSWNTILTLGTNKNKVLELADEDYLQNGTGSALIIGEPVGTFYGVKYLGVWQADDPELGNHNPGDPKWKDLNDDGVISEFDREIVGDPNPDFYGGWNNTLAYKRFSLDVFFDFSVGNDIYDLAGKTFNTGFTTNVYGKYRDRWKENNTDSNIPRAGSMEVYYMDQAAAFGNDFDVYNGSFLRLKSVNLQYDIPVKNIKYFKNVQVYTNVSNLFTVTGYKGFTPDVNASGTDATRRGFDNNVYPLSRTMIIGVNVKF